jgi:hypothetical protein
MEAWFPKYAVSGILYNVIKRPLSGGKGSIVQHKPTKSRPLGESEAEFYDRLQGIIREMPQEFFLRLEAKISSSEIAAFRVSCLDPILENVCYWYDSVTGKQSPAPPASWRHPYGVRNLLDEGGISDLDHYLTTGSTVGLQRRESLFNELEGAN